MKSDLAIQRLADVLWDALLISVPLLGVTLMGTGNRGSPAQPMLMLNAPS